MNLLNLSIFYLFLDCNFYLLCLFYKLKRRRSLHFKSFCYLYFIEFTQTLTIKMKYVAAYMLAALNGEAPSKSAVQSILESVGAAINDEQLDKVFAELDGKNVDEVVAEGMGKLASVLSGGAAPAAAGAAAGGDAAAPAEEKAASESEESSGDMGFDLFG